MMVLDSSGIHPFIGASPPFSTLHVCGDIEAHVFTDRHKSVFIDCPQHREEGKIALLAVRIMLDSETLQVPPVDFDVGDIKNYFSCLPRRAVVYAMRNGTRVNYGLDDLRRDWQKIFKKNAYYRHLARTRYKSSKQALIEFHSSTNRGNRFFQTLTRTLYGRITAYTEECASRALLGAAVVLEFPSMFRQAIPLVSF